MEVTFRQAMDNAVTFDFPFQTRSSLLLSTMNVEEEVEAQRFRLVSKIEEFVRNGSGYIVTAVKDISLMLTRSVILVA